ncbi:MAG: class I SAM-dependent DNA methyltransferase [Opitutae bacterium]|nr:class I SAM-dependent DNA methyltransferase [Opitutae bacterium]
MSPPPRPHLIPTLSREEMRSRALAFARRWAGPQREEAEAQTFLDEFFQIFGRDRRNVDAAFEHRVEREARGEGRLDLFWPGKLVVEMKSTGKDLSAATNGAARQAFDYLEHVDPEARPRWVLVSDFAHFVLYDLGEDVHDYLKGLAAAHQPKPSLVAQFPLGDLPDKLRHFAFIRDEEQALFQTQPEVNLKAVALLGDLHDELKKSGYTGHQLERFLVRALFCLFAEDTDIFGWNTFTRFVEGARKAGSDLGPRLAQLFQVLDQDTPARSTKLTDEFTAFPYVNGGLFAERLDIAATTADHRAALLACCRFDWSRISPGVFGSLFQGVMDKKERRAKGAHYTSEENIRRVIDPLFLDELKARFAKLRDGAAKKKALEQFHLELASLRFLDPACGCGNFLVVAYRELRALELELLRAQYGGQLPLGLEVGDLARVNVDQFYGIELEEFPALIAETALWLTDHQVNMAFSKAFGRHFARIPLKKSPTIRQGNALRLDWRDILPPRRCSHVLGNPPFVGSKFMSAEQSADMEQVGGSIRSFGVLDYVAAWYVKAADYIRGTGIRCAFVSTNSITQGEQVSVLWSYLFRQRLKIHFAHRTFVWHNEAGGKAHVHVVVIGFAAYDATLKQLFDYGADGMQSASSGTANVNPYLIVGNDTLVSARSTPLSAVPPIDNGSIPADGGHLILEPAVKSALVAAEPAAAKWLRPYLGAEGFIHNRFRYCLWLVDCPPNELRRMPHVMSRVASVRAMRLASEKAATRKKAATPTLFTENRQPKKGHYLALPRTSSENRCYIPIGFLSAEIIAANDLQIIPDATPFVFGVVTSAMHRAWTNITSGRLKSDIRYSVKLTYNTYPWPDPTYPQRTAIEAAARAVLDARAPHLARGASLADLYDPLAMPAALLKAHQALDRAVDKSYRTAVFTSDRERVEFLFARYEQLVAPLAPAAPPRRRQKKLAAATSFTPLTPAEFEARDIDFGVKEDPPAP